ncbi:MAG: hypothetical protein NUW01_06575, partial [Gemmatimonadaceae bacterium]|nr:hypothetical protein [Gemmatimonadaceae bacterium]
LARNSGEIRRLLALPQAGKLPRRVREEATAIAKSDGYGHAAPVHALHYYYTLTHLLDENNDPLFEGDIGHAERTQIELPLRTASGF